MVSHPLISIIIPVFNGERYLAEAIQSVLGQTYRPIEIIVVDDGSTDQSAAVAQSFAMVQVCGQANAGVGAALNRGIGVARGDYFAFLDADDLWVEDKLACQIAAFEQDAELDMVFGNAQQFHSHDTPGGYRELEVMSGYSKGTMLIKRAAFFRVGFFATQWHLGDFIEWYARANESGLKHVSLDIIMLKRRLHADNMGVREYDYRKEYVHILKQVLDRRQKKE